MRIDTMNLSDIWQVIEKEAAANPEHITGLNATYAVHLTGEEPGEYGITFQNGTLSITDGIMKDADCTLILSSTSFKKLLEGKLNTTAAFMTGKLKVKGNISLALKLESTLKKFEF